MQGRISADLWAVASLPFPLAPPKVRTLCVCVYVTLCVCVYVHCVCMYTTQCLCVCVCTLRVCVYNSVSVCMCVCTLCVYVYNSVSVCVCACTQRLCMCVQTHCTHFQGCRNARGTGMPFLLAPRIHTHTHSHTHTHTMDSGKVQGIGTCVRGPGQFRMDHESLVQWLHRMVLAGVVGFVMCVVYWCSIR